MPRKGNGLAALAAYEVVLVRVGFGPFAAGVADPGVQPSVQEVVREAAKAVIVTLGNLQALSARLASAAATVTEDGRVCLLDAPHVSAVPVAAGVGAPTLLPLAGAVANPLVGGVSAAIAPGA